MSEASDTVTWCVTMVCITVGFVAFCHYTATCLAPVHSAPAPAAACAPATSH